VEALRLLFDGAAQGRCHLSGRDSPLRDLECQRCLQDCGCLRDMRAIFAAAAADVASPLQQSRENYVTSSALRERTTSVLRIVPTWRLV
jgi:hypothetical protein